MIMSCHSLNSVGFFLHISCPCSYKGTVLPKRKQFLSFPFPHLWLAVRGFGTFLSSSPTPLPPCPFTCGQFDFPEVGPMPPCSPLNYHQPMGFSLQTQLSILASSSFKKNNCGAVTSTENLS